MSQTPSSKLSESAQRLLSQERCLKDDDLQRHCLDWPPHTPRLLRNSILVTEANSESQFISSSAGVKSFLNRISELRTETQHPNLYLALEGNSHGRTGTISILQLYVEPLNEVYLFDINALGVAAFATSTNEALCLKNVLQDGNIKKAFFDPRQDSAVLYALYGVKLKGVIDVQVMHCAITDPTKCVLSFKKCVAELPFKDEELQAVKEVKDKGYGLYKDDGGAVFDERPLPLKLLQYCIEDVVLLAALYKQCERKMTTNLWHNCNNVFHIRIEMSLAPDYGINPKSSKCPWALHKKGNSKGLPMHDTIDWDPTAEDIAFRPGNFRGDQTPDCAARQKQGEQKREEIVKASPTVINISPASRSSQQKQGPSMRQLSTSEGGKFTGGYGEDSGHDFEDSLLMGKSLPTQENRFTSASDLEMSLVEEATDARAQRARAQTSFHSSDPLSYSSFNLSLTLPPPTLPAPQTSQSDISSLASSFYPQQPTMLDSSLNSFLTSSYYPGQTRMLDSSFDQSTIRAPTPQPDFSHPSPERRVSVTRRPAAMDGIAQAFRDEQLYSDTASFSTGGLLTDSSSPEGSNERSMIGAQRQTNMAQAQNMTQFVLTSALTDAPPSPPVPELRRGAKPPKCAEREGTRIT